MKARGKREARRPWLSSSMNDRGLKGRNMTTGITPFQGCRGFLFCYPGATRFALAPGYHISRRWRSGPTFCAKPGPHLCESRRLRCSEIRDGCGNAQGAGFQMSKCRFQNFSRCVLWQFCNDDSLSRRHVVRQRFSAMLVNDLLSKYSSRPDDNVGLRGLAQ